MVRMDLTKIIISESVDSQVIVLSERGGARSFPIVIGIMEAMAIDRAVKGIDSPRPMTHDLLASAIEQLGGTLTRIVVNSLRDGTFFAVLDIARDDDEPVEVDCRPSDAIATAVRTGAEIYVAADVLDEVSRG